MSITNYRSLKQTIITEWAREFEQIAIQFLSQDQNQIGRAKERFSPGIVLLWRYTSLFNVNMFSDIFLFMIALILQSIQLKPNSMGFSILQRTLFLKVNLQPSWTRSHFNVLLLCDYNPHINGAVPPSSSPPPASNISGRKYQPAAHLCCGWSLQAKGNGWSLSKLLWRVQSL